MNKDINIMIQLQKIWDIVLKEQEVIERSEKSINFWKKNLSEKKAEVEKYEGLLRDLKKSLKENETDLAQLEAHLAKTGERLKLVKSEKELEAQKHEYDKIEGDKDVKEESLINLMDELDANENKFETLKTELKESEKQVSEDTDELERKIKSAKSNIDENQNEFNAILENLSPEYRSRFQKLISSKNGKGIGEVNGEICSSCNFQIPASLAEESASDEKAVSCTNCGRFIYRAN
jgi:predicted  nucleic acid-binding Zn-ribbon protein